MTSDRDAAFAAAARARGHRDEFEREVSERGLDLNAVFDRADTDPLIASMKILPLLEALPDVGKVKSRRALEAAAIAESARVGSVDATRRSALAVALSDPSSAP